MPKSDDVRHAYLRGKLESLLAHTEGAREEILALMAKADRREMVYTGKYPTRRFVKK